MQKSTTAIKNIQKGTNISLVLILELLASLAQIIQLKKAMKAFINKQRVAVYKQRPVAANNNKDADASLFPAKIYNS